MWVARRVSPEGDPQNWDTRRESLKGVTRSVTQKQVPRSGRKNGSPVGVTKDGDHKFVPRRVSENEVRSGRRKRSP
jgi:hypothetical protein